MTISSVDKEYQQKIDEVQRDMEGGWFHSKTPFRDYDGSHRGRPPASWRPSYGVDALERLLANGEATMGKGFERKISRFLRDHYSLHEQRWCILLQECDSLDKLTAHFVCLINDMQEHFGRSSEERLAVRTSDASLHHPPPSITGINILGTSCATPTKTITDPYNRDDAFTVTPILVVRSTDTPTDIHLSIGVRAKELFLRQPTRRFVRGLVLTDTDMRVYHFDRAGAMCLDALDIHANPVLFVKTVLVLSAMDDDVFGGDSSVKYEHWGARTITLTMPHVLAKRGHGMYTVASEAPETYTIARPGHAAFRKTHLRGNGPVGWAVTDSTGRELWIKDIWLSPVHIPEHELLVDAHGIDGVAQIVAFQTYPEESAVKMRGLEGGPYPPDCVRTRIVMRRYGKQIRNFKDEMHLLTAFYDAIAGHRDLYCDMHILHRDVSVTNILLGKPNEVGNRGVLVDFDLGVRKDTDQKEYCSEQVGTFAFMSTRLLRNGVAAYTHTHIDDLESFLYVLVWIVCATKRTPDMPFPAFLETWDNGDARAAAAAKRAFLAQPLNKTLETTLGDGFRVLLDALRSFFHAWVDGPRDGEEGLDADDRARADYQAVLAIVEEAIERLKAERQEAEALTNKAATSASNAATSTGKVSTLVDATSALAGTERTRADTNADPASTTVIPSSVSATSVGATASSDENSAPLTTTPLAPPKFKRRPIVKSEDDITKQLKGGGRTRSHAAAAPATPKEATKSAVVPQEGKKKVKTVPAEVATVVKRKRNREVLATEKENDAAAKRLAKKRRAAVPPAPAKKQGTRAAAVVANVPAGRVTRSMMGASGAAAATLKLVSPLKADPRKRR